MGKKQNKKAGIAKHIRRQIEAVLATIEKYHNGFITPEQAELMMSSYDGEEKEAPCIDEALYEGRIGIAEDDDYRYSDKELKELAAMYKEDGNILAANRIFGLLRPFLFWMYQRLPLRGMSDEDYLGMCYSVVMQYLDEYNQVRGEKYQFTNLLAHRLVDAAREEIEDSNLIHLNGKAVSEIVRCLDRHESQGETVTISMIAQEVGRSEEFVLYAILLRENRLFVSLEVNVTTNDYDEGKCVSDVLTNSGHAGEHIKVSDVESDNGKSMTDFEIIEMKRDVNAALDALPPMEAAVIKLYCGFDEEMDPMGHEKIRKVLNISREQERQAFKRAVVKLQNLLGNYDDDMLR